jgi:hypothetical protein
MKLAWLAIATTAPATAARTPTGSFAVGTLAGRALTRRSVAGRWATGLAGGRPVSCECTVRGIDALDRLECGLNGRQGRVSAGDRRRQDRAWLSHRGWSLDSRLTRRSRPTLAVMALLALLALARPAAAL